AGPRRRPGGGWPPGPRGGRPHRRQGPPRLHRFLRHSLGEPHFPAWHPSCDGTARGSVEAGGPPVHCVLAARRAKSRQVAVAADRSGAVMALPQAARRCYTRTASVETCMAKDAIVSQELADKFKTEKDSPYLRFVRGEGLDIISAQYGRNLRTVELKPWARKSGKGVFINHEASRTSNDCYVCEIAPGKTLEPQHHLFEEMILVLSGRGSTAVWNNAGAR